MVLLGTLHGVEIRPVPDAPAVSRGDRLYITQRTAPTSEDRFVVWVPQTQTDDTDPTGPKLLVGHLAINPLTVAHIAVMDGGHCPGFYGSFVATVDPRLSATVYINVEDPTAYTRNDLWYIFWELYPEFQINTEIGQVRIVDNPSPGSSVAEGEAGEDSDGASSYHSNPYSPSLENRAPPPPPSATPPLRLILADVQADVTAQPGYGTTPVSRHFPAAVARRQGGGPGLDFGDVGAGAEGAEEGEGVAAGRGTVEGAGDDVGSWGDTNGGSDAEDEADEAEGLDDFDVEAFVAERLHQAWSYGPAPTNLKKAASVVASGTQQGGEWNIDAEEICSGLDDLHLGRKGKIGAPKNCFRFYEPLKDTILFPGEGALFGLEISKVSHKMLCRLDGCDKVCGVRGQNEVEGGDPGWDGMCTKHYYRHLRDPKLRKKYSDSYAAHSKNYGDKYKEMTEHVIPEHDEDKVYKVGHLLQYVLKSGKSFIKCRVIECQNKSENKDNLCRRHGSRYNTAEQQAAEEMRTTHLRKLENGQTSDLDLVENLLQMSYPASKTDIEKNPNWQRDLDADKHMTEDNAWLHCWFLGDDNTLDNWILDENGDIALIPIRELLKLDRRKILKMHPHLRNPKVDKNFEDPYTWATTNYRGGLVFMLTHHHHEIEEGTVFYCAHVTPANRQRNGLNYWRRYHQYKILWESGGGKKMDKSHACMVRAKESVRPCFITKYVMEKGGLIRKADVTVVRVNGDMETPVCIDARAKGAFDITDLGVYWDGSTGQRKTAHN